MRTSYELALNYINLSLSDEYIRKTEANDQNIIGIGNSTVIYDIYKYEDQMDIEPSSYTFENKNEQYLNIFDYFPNISVASTIFVGYKTVQRAVETTSKSMLLALLDGDSKRTTTIGIGTTGEKIETFLNCLKLPGYRSNTSKPWNTWRNSVGICTPVSISRTDNVATVTTNPPHGLSASFDDWGVVMNLNTGIATSFNISTSTYPNGVPVKITSSNTFTYRNTGINTVISNVTGTADIRVGWGGTSNNFHLYIY